MSQLVDKVAQHLGVSRDRAETLIGDLVDGIIALSADGTEVVLPGLGTFTRGEQGIHFEPDPRLAVVVNHRFAGLAPVSVESVSESGGSDDIGFALPDIPIAFPHDRESAPYAGDAAGGGNDGSSHDVGIADVDSGEGREPDLQGADPSSADASRDSGVVPEWDYDAAPATDSELVDEEGSASTDDDGTEESEAWTLQAGLPELWQTEWESPESLQSDDSFTAESGEHSRVPDDGDRVFGAARVAPPEFASEETVLPEPSHDIISLAPEPADAKTVTDKPAETTQPDTDDTTPAASAPAGSAPAAPVVARRSRSLLYVGLIIVLALAIAGVLYVLGRGGDESVPPDTEVVEGAPGGPAGGGAEAAPPAETGEAPAPEIAWEPGAIDRRAGGYTLIVSSEQTIQEANAVALEMSTKLADLGMPVDVLQGTARGRNVYRVAVGQFPRQSIANRELRRLANRLPEGAWLLRLRRNM